jgi:hypothetical protein
MLEEIEGKNVRIEIKIYVWNNIKMTQGTKINISRNTLN